MLAINRIGWDFYLESGCKITGSLTDITNELMVLAIWSPEKFGEDTTRLGKSVVLRNSQFATILTQKWAQGGSKYMIKHCTVFIERQKNNAERCLWSDYSLGTIKTFRSKSVSDKPNLLLLLSGLNTKAWSLTKQRCDLSDLSVGRWQKNNCHNQHLPLRNHSDKFFNINVLSQSALLEAFTNLGL